MALTKVEKLRPAKKEINREAWTAEDNRTLAEAVEIHGPKRWKTIATTTARYQVRTCAGAGMCWLLFDFQLHLLVRNVHLCRKNLILRLHKLLGNRWSLIVGRLPRRTNNEIKKYWTSHLGKKIKKSNEGISRKEEDSMSEEPMGEKINTAKSNVTSSSEDSKNSFDLDDFFYFSSENPSTLEWISKFVEFGGVD